MEMIKSIQTCETAVIYVRKSRIFGSLWFCETGTHNKGAHFIPGGHAFGYKEAHYYSTHALIFGQKRGFTEPYCDILYRGSIAT
ncbi:MAG: hypothetical protein WCV79_03215 [Candidatus Paceibacterota bacterium]|jgi:hypothetical protein